LIGFINKLSVKVENKERRRNNASSEITM